MTNQIAIVSPEPSRSVTATVCLLSVGVRVSWPDGASYDELRRLILEAALSRMDGADGEPAILACEVKELEQRPVGPTFSPSRFPLP